VRNSKFLYIDVHGLIIKENSIEISEENLLQLKYDPGSVWGYVEV
jgi:hypothetical protein